MENNSSQTVFIVEDDKFLRSLLSKKLESQAYNVETATDIGSAFKKIKEASPDIVLLDLVLPGGSGYDVLKQLKADEQLKDVPVLILSNLGQKEEVEKGLVLGATDYLIKAHFTPEEVLSKIQETIGTP